MANYGKYQGYMTHNPPTLEGYTILNTFKTKAEAREELQYLKDSYKKGKIEPHYEGWVIYEKL